MTHTNPSLKDIFHQFQIDGIFFSAEPFGSGHINDTYLIKTLQPNSSDYILQRINHNIFTNPTALMSNIVQVTQHIKSKLNPNIHADRECLTAIPTINQDYIFIDSENNHWVCYIYIADSFSHDIVKNSKQAFEGGKILGRFLDLINDFPSNLLHETLPNFHNVEFRLANFENAIDINYQNRISHCQSEIDFVRVHGIEMQQIMLLGKQGKIPLRVVHNDTKFNNILLDSQDNGLCVIDLDTVMPGYIHYDFSDAVRTVANSAAEDEQDLGKINFNTELFAAFCKGFLGELKSSLNTHEINSLAESAPLMPFMHGMRFLTDYLSGDVYYKTHFPEHNLQRARAQFQLVRCMQEKMSQLKSIVLETVEMATATS